MREITLRRVLGISGIFALAMLFLSCPDEPIREQHGKAMVSFSVADSTARTVLPQASLADVASYQLLGGLKGAAETVLVESFTGTGTSLFLVSGTWNFTLNAYNNAGGHILQKRLADISISSAGTNQVSFYLSPVNSGTGAIQITLNFPESAGITRIVVKSGTDSENFTPANSGSFVYSRDGVAAGDHLISFELYRGDMLRAVVTELVVVRNNLTSGKTITLVGDNLKPVITVNIAIGLTGLNEWEGMIEQTAQAAVNVNKVFTVNGTYTAYRWYLDGTQVGTSSNYTFNKPVGVYQLVAVATNSAGESRSGRCRITVAPSLTANVWTDGNSADANGEDWYSFPVSAGTTYRVWWNDRKAGDETQNGDVAVSARYENETAFIFGGTDTAVDSGWTAAQSFTANQTGTVFIRVIPYDRSNANTGTYRIAYNTDTYRPAIYTVTFNINNGIGTPPATQTVISGSGITLPDGSGFSRDGYFFGGWSTSPSGGTPYGAGSAYTPTGDITLYARWDVYYTVTFNINGGTGTTPASQTVIPGSTTNLPDGSGLSKSGYTFGGWNIYAGGQGSNYAAGSAYRPTGDITLYATWYENYTVTFNINGGTGTPPAARSINQGSSITLPDGSGFSREGYSFGGWSTRADSSGTNYNAGASYTLTENISIILYARWNIVGGYSVIFDINGGTGTPPPTREVHAGTSIILPTGSGFSKSGYAFGGWNTRADGSGANYNAGASYTVTGFTGFYARWHAIYTVTFDRNGGSGTLPSAQTGSAISSITLPDGSGLSRNGYFFVGWNTSANGGGTHYNAGASYTPTDNITLYAGWSSGQAANVWSYASISSATQEIRHQFFVTAGTTYYVWWNDSKQGSGSQTLDVRVSAQYGNGTTIFTNIDSGYNTPQQFTSNQNGSVTLIVVPYSPGSTGIYGIVYSTSSTRPAP